jgi:hypothetical protein
MFNYTFRKSAETFAWWVQPGYGDPVLLPMSARGWSCPYLRGGLQ